MTCTGSPSNMNLLNTGVTTYQTGCDPNGSQNSNAPCNQIIQDQSSYPNGDRSEWAWGFSTTEYWTATFQ